MGFLLKRGVDAIAVACNNHLVLSPYLVYSKYRSKKSQEISKKGTWPMGNFRKGRHCVFLMHVHLVFVTKYRRGAFCEESLVQLEEIFDSVCEDFESELVEFNGEADHIHLLVRYPPKVCVSKLVNSLKGVSSRLLRKEPSERLKKALEWSKSLWSPSYFAGSCGGAPLETIKEYITQQQRLESECNKKEDGASSPA
jgi:putative transposase